MTAATEVLAKFRPEWEKTWRPQVLALIRRKSKNRVWLGLVGLVGLVGLEFFGLVWFCLVLFGIVFWFGGLVGNMPFARNLAHKLTTFNHKPVTNDSLPEFLNSILKL